MQTQINEALTDKKGMAFYLKVTQRTVDNYMLLGLIPYLKIGRSVRFRISDVQAALDKNCRISKARQ